MADNSKLAYIGLIPTKEDAQRLVVEGGLKQEDLHATLIFLGEASQYSTEAQNNITSSVEQTANSYPLVQASGFSIDIFNPDTENSCIVLGLSGPELCDIKDDICLRLSENIEAMEIDNTEIPPQKEPWIPHVTLIYTNNAELATTLTDRVGPISFDRIRVQFADTIVDYPLTHGGEEDNMASRVSYLVDASTLDLSEDGVGKWVHALPIGVFNHPLYGKLDITAEKAQSYAESVKQKVRGIEPSINYDHNNTGDAAGWVKDAEARTNGLWLFVDFTKTAIGKLKEKAYKYFSIEFDTEWEDAQGNKFADVVFGGALTNRPFMKNLVPINLSEANLTQMMDVFAALTGKDFTPEKGGKDSMELSEAQVNDIVTKLAEKLKVEPPKVPPTPEPLKLSEVEELKQLSEENPLVKALIQQVESQGSNIVETQKQLRETEISMRLAEFDKSKLVLTPVAKKLVYGLLTEMPAQLHENFWQLMDHMRKSQSFLVELGERSGVNVKYGVDRSPAKVFNDLVNKKLAEGLDYPTAVEKVAAENKDLYEAYRQESFAFKA